MTRLRALALRITPTAVKATLIAGIAVALVVVSPVAVAVLVVAFSLDRSEP